MCAYCAQCAVVNQIVPIEGLSRPIRMTEYPDQPGDPCRWVIYKDPLGFPDQAYLAVGKSRDGWHRMNHQGQVVVCAEAQHALPRARSEAFAREGAKVEWIARSADVGEFARTHEPPDTLVVSVPHFARGSFAGLAEAAWHEALLGELGRVIHVLRAIGTQMTERRNGCILVVGTLAGTTGFPEWTLASTIEGALVALTRSLACEWAAQNVRIVYVACGAIERDVPACRWSRNVVSANPVGANGYHRRDCPDGAVSGKFPRKFHNRQRDPR